MKKPANSNNGSMYGVAAEGVLAVYGSLLEGTGNETVLAVSSNALGESARKALAASTEALGYGRDCLALVATEGVLGSNDLLTIVEGLDPLCLVATDAEASALLAQAYRHDVEPDTACRLMGRSVVAFRDLAALMNTPEDKQRAWALLKKLPKIN